MKRFKKYTLFGLSIIVLAIYIRTVIGEPCKVPTESMEPAIRPGQWLWIDKLSYGGRLPERWADILLLVIISTFAAANCKKDIIFAKNSN